MSLDYILVYKSRKLAWRKIINIKCLSNLNYFINLFKLVNLVLYQRLDGVYVFLAGTENHIKICVILFYQVFISLHFTPHQSLMMIS